MYMKESPFHAVTLNLRHGFMVQRSEGRGSRCNFCCCATKTIQGKVMHKHMMRIWLLSLLGLFNLQMAQAEELTGDTLVTALKQGNWVLVMRHTSSPRELPTALNKAVNNDKGERQLDAKGRDDAAAFGEALRRLNVTVDEVKSSPAFRARQTALLAGFA